MLRSSDLSDVFLGRIDALRINADGLLDDFTRYHQNNSSFSSSALATSIKSRIDRSQQYFNILNQFRVTYENATNGLPELTYKQGLLTDEILFEHKVKESARIACHEYALGLSKYFPKTYPRLNGKLQLNPYLIVNQSKGSFGKYRPTNMKMIQQIVKDRQFDIVFRIQRKSMNDKRCIQGIQCTINKEFQLVMSFSPWVAETIEKSTNEQATQNNVENLEENFIEQLSKSLYMIVILGIDEDAAIGIYKTSKYKILCRINDHATFAWNEFRKYDKETCFLHFMSWMSTYHKIYGTPCCACNKILADESNGTGYIPPSIREYSTGRAYHSNCITAIQQ